MSAVLLADAPVRTAPLHRFVAGFRLLLDNAPIERETLERGGRLLADLISRDDWLPDAYAAPDPHRYQQYLLHRDPSARFSVVSFVWGPGQATPIHDHGVWGLVGVLRGGEMAERFVRGEDGALVSVAPAALLAPGEIDAVSPHIGDIHRVANAYDDRTSISVHVYGADIGAVERRTYHADGRAKPFVSGYAALPPLLP